MSAFSDLSPESGMEQILVRNRWIDITILDSNSFIVDTKHVWFAFSLPLCLKQQSEGSYGGQNAGQSLTDGSCSMVILGKQSAGNYEPELQSCVSDIWSSSVGPDEARRGSSVSPISQVRATVAWP